jgi:hypothetical protein
MKLFIFLMIFLLFIFITESFPNGLTFLSCPNGDGLINCKEVKCCPSHNTTCCLDESVLKERIPIACGSIFPEGHPLGCCGLKSCSEK